jgi:hypothetical protein
MRFTGFLAVAAAAIAIGLMAAPQAQAFDHGRTDAPSGWVGVRDVRHWVYYPRYRHYYLTNGSTDPFAYRYEPRGYYPYYNSGYWKPRSHVVVKRAHFAHPKYYKAWGANRKHYDHSKWHAVHHGRHDHAHY